MTYNDQVANIKERSQFEADLNYLGLQSFEVKT